MSSTIPTPSELDGLAQIDPEMGAMFECLPRPPAHYPDPVQFVHDMRDSFDLPPSKPDPQVRESKSSYMTRDGTTLSIHIWAPSISDKPFPLVVWYHGGGGCVGSPDMNARLHRDTVKSLQCVVAAVQYRLAPEYKYPTGVDDSWDALKHIASRASDYGADALTGFVIGGESAGSTIAALLALRARDEKLYPPVTGLFLSAGSYLDPNDVPQQYRDVYRSRNDPTCMDAPMLGRGMRAVFDACLKPDYSSPHFRAAIWTTGHVGLPRTYFQTCGMDVHRDDSFVYRDILQKSGVETRLDVYPGSPHCFWFLFRDTAQGRKWKNDNNDAFRWLFAKAS
ncbi:Hypothetical protein R9X50_00432900 [Acrodontium crateriforme]|uniref:Alpha/beta hydrolase fold-3 domain-containing protein n=1 Tax=Acrodontium crateriforme TaxID=150365 RepID=A0AAQ3RCN1_9PEZI|nr:Hypothetical protein R9X50_00432900 [Acrodontium crateriforme]